MDLQGSPGAPGLSREDRSARAEHAQKHHFTLNQGRCSDLECVQIRPANRHSLFEIVATLEPGLGDEQLWW